MALYAEKKVVAEFLNSSENIYLIWLLRFFLCLLLVWFDILGGSTEKLDCVRVVEHTEHASNGILESILYCIDKLKGMGNFMNSLVGLGQYFVSMSKDVGKLGSKYGTIFFVLVVSLRIESSLSHICNATDQFSCFVPTVYHRLC